MSAATGSATPRIVIAGGGLAGSVPGAGAQARARPTASTWSCAIRPSSATRTATSAPMPSPRRRAGCWQALGVWDQVAERAQPILDMVITDSRLQDPVRPTFLTFAGEVDGNEPFAHMVDGRRPDRRAARGLPRGRRRLAARGREGLCRPGRRTDVALSERRESAGRPAGGRRRRALAPARAGGHRLDLLALPPVRHRRHHRP